MKKIICALMIVCSAFFTASCACRNDESPEYTFNAVIAGVKDTDGGVTVELLPIVPDSPYSDTYTGSDITPVYGYTRYEGKGDYNTYTGAWYVKSQNVLTFKLRRQDKAEELLEFDEDMIIKFTVMDGTIYRFENTECVFIENDSWKDWYNDYGGEIIYD